jgi:hypothetical protein
LSLTSPTNNTIAYKVIQSNSAVNSKWRAVFVLINKLPKIKKKKINNVFKSPKNKIN